MITPAYIKRRTELRFCVLDIGLKTRKGKYPYYRYVYFKLCRDFTNATYAEIGKICGEREHCTVKNGLTKFIGEIEVNLATSREFINAYHELHNFLTEVKLRTKNKKSFEQEMKDPEALRREYKIRLWKIIQKNHELIKKVYYFRDSKILNLLYGLPDKDIEEFEVMAKKFLKEKHKSLLN